MRARGTGVSRLSLPEMDNPDLRKPDRSASAFAQLVHCVDDAGLTLEVQDVSPIAGAQVAKSWDENAAPFAAITTFRPSPVLGREEPRARVRRVRHLGWRSSQADVRGDAGSLPLLET